MIVKVPTARQHGGSSFQSLASYITAGFNRANTTTGNTNSKAEVKSDTKATSWERLTQYISRDHALQQSSGKSDKTLAIEIGNVASLDTAAAEMKLVASYNLRVDNPTLHYILSWPEHEQPAAAQIFDAARASLQALGLAAHQYIVAIHGNTDNLHAHIAVNRVHPTTYKAARIEWLHKTLHRAAREIEIKHGWSHDSGLFKVIELKGVKYVVPNTAYVDPEQAKVQGGAAQFETWHGEQSLETWCRGEPASALRQVLAAPETNNWQAIHNTLANFGLALRDSGGGGMRVQVLADEMSELGAPSSVISLKASKAFRFLKRAELEQRFGPFISASLPSDLPAPQTAKSYLRDPAKRLERKLERRALRDALFQRFQEEQTQAREWHALASKRIKTEFNTADAARRSALQRDYQQKRTAIKADAALSSRAKQQAYMLAKLTMLQARQQLDEQIKRQRAERKTLLPALLTWRQWVEQQALAGDEAAISALRGMVYQAGRERRAAEKEESENAILPAQPALTEPLVRKLKQLVWRVERNGNVAYNFNNGDQAFIDAGERLLFARAEVSDAALALSLQYAQDKWRGPLLLRGGDRLFKARAAAMAAELGIALAGRDKPAAMPVSAEQQLRAKFPSADISHAKIQAGNYSGKIVTQDARYFALAVGGGQYVLHERSALGASGPSVGERVTIVYRDGGVVVTTRKPRER